MHTFEEFELSPEIHKAVQELGFSSCTPIQYETLSALLKDPTDFLGLAATGTGKTAAFGIPLLERIDPKVRGIQGIILCPTRELAMQVSKQIVALAKYKKIKIATIYGGAGYTDQIRELKVCSVVVATPGRLIDHLDRKNLSLKLINTVVLDEADEMISMGFRDDLELILKQTESDNRLTWLFSATLNSDLRQVASRYLEKPKTVTLNQKEEASKNIEQLYFIVEERNKPKLLLRLLDSEEDFYGLIFCQTKIKVDEIYQALKQRHFSVECLHGDKSQKERERSMQAFRDAKAKIMVATDVAARGLDVNKINVVVNYSIPMDAEVYTHRIGRTGRIGNKGRSISFFAPQEEYLFKNIERQSRMPLKRGEIASSKDIFKKQTQAYLEEFMATDKSEKVLSWLPPEWDAIADSFSSHEIIARFLSLQFSKLISESPGSKEQILEEHFWPARRGPSSGNRRGGYGGNRSGAGSSRGNTRSYGPRRR